MLARFDRTVVMPPRILFNITHGFQARMLLRTRIAEDLLAAGCTLIVVSPNADENYFRSEWDRPGFELQKMPSRNPKVEKLVVGLRQYFLMNPALGKTLNFKREQFRRQRPLWWAVTRGGNLFFGRSSKLRQAYLRCEETYFSGSEYDDVLKRAQPDLVVSGTPGFNVFDAHVLRSARRLGVASTTVMLSWDNLTSKGYMGAHPDSLLVWNDLMRKEAVRYQSYEGPITEVGAAQFDVYRELEPERARRSFREKHQIPQDADLVVWGTINEAIYPGQIQELRRYAQEVESDPKKFLWVRVHPQSIFGPFAHLKAEYLALASARVRVEIPPVASKTLAWDLPKSDMTHLASLLFAAQVVIVPQSTLSIDAACAGTPVINVGIAPWFRRTFEYTHYKELVNQRAVWVVKSLAELKSAVDTYIRDPQRDRAGRETLIRQQMGRYFGRAGSRTAEVLLAKASGEAEPH